MEMTLSSLNERDLLSLLRVFFEYTRCAVSVSRGDGVFMMANAECESCYGFSSKEFAGQSLGVFQARDIFNPSVALQVIRRKRAIRTTLRDKAGFTRPIVGVPLFREPGRVAYVVCFSAWDVTSYEELRAEYNRLEGELRRYASEVRQLRAMGNAGHTAVTESPSMREIHKLLAQIAPYSAPALFIGEKGVGKSYLARQLHNLGAYQNGPFIEFNCGVIPDGLVEAELFGSSGNGMGNGCNQGLGALSLARGGTLLLQDVHALPLRVQSQLAMLLAKARSSDSGSAGKNIGEVKSDESEVRIMASTTRDLSSLTQQGGFYQELYYALSTIPIEILPLRKRPEDVLAFLLQYLEQGNSRYSLGKRLTQPAMDKLLAYGWPGNVSEVRSLMERMLLMCPDTLIRLSHLPDYIRGGSDVPDEVGLNLKKSMEFHERRIVLLAYETHKTTVALARALGISQPSAVRKLAKYNGKAAVRHGAAGEMTQAPSTGVRRKGLKE